MSISFAVHFDLVLYAVNHPTSLTGITHVIIVRRGPSFTTGFSLRFVISSQATPAGADLRWGRLVGECMVIVINGSYIGYSDVPFSVHATGSLSGAPSELFIALFQRLDS